MNEQRGAFTYAGAFSDAFPEADAQLSNIAYNGRADNQEKLDPHAPDFGQILELGAAYPGTMGVFDARPVVTSTAGPWLPRYGGNLPNSQLPRLSHVAPWDDPHAP